MLPDQRSLQPAVPEGFLLSILQEQLGPHVGASPLNLLSVVGRNAIGRVKVATPGSDPAQPPVAFELNGILRGDNSEEAFVELVRKHATSGVSGVVPKFLSPSTLGEHGKGTLATDRYIIKGTTARLPGVLHAWNDGMNSLRLQKTWSLPNLEAPIAAAKFSDPLPIKHRKAEKIGRSPLLGQR